MPTQKSISPRLAAECSSSFTDGMMGTVLGSGKTVIRGGYAINYNRVQAVGVVQFPMIGNAALAQPNVINAPPCAFSGTPGPGCVTGQPFRVGVDGPAPLPVITPSIPIPVCSTITVRAGAGEHARMGPGFQGRTGS